MDNVVVIKVKTIGTFSTKLIGKFAPTGDRLMAHKKGEPIRSFLWCMALQQHGGGTPLSLHHLT